MCYNIYKEKNENKLFQTHNLKINTLQFSK